LQRQSSHYIPGLDGMRAIALIIVLIAHSMPHRDLPGGFGVTVFFFLSGYLITTLLRAEAQVSSRISLRNFYIRRVLRILPPCYLTIGVVSSLAALGLVYNRESFRSLVAAFLFFSNYWNIFGLGNLPAGMGILWSLAVEEHYYLLFPVLYWGFVIRKTSRRQQAFCLLAFCAAALAWRCWRVGVMHSPWENIYEGTDTRFDSILFGCVLAIAANPRLGDSVGRWARHARPLAWAGVGLLLFTFAVRNSFFRETFRYSLQGIALTPIFFLVTLPEGSLLTRLLEFRPLRHMGRLSYAMYLIHHTFFHHLYHSYRPNLGIALAVVAASAAYAQAMRTLVELPIQRMRARFTRQDSSVVRAFPEHVASDRTVMRAS
jgi:peptidoglycan/LPS O-acetylase OafA/YrhL